jgi:hypothetical protein
MALKTRSRSQSIGEDDSPEDILAEKYRDADGVREMDPSERRQGGGRECHRPWITSATWVNRIAAGAQATQFPEERHRCFVVIGVRIRDRSAREDRIELQKCGRRWREAWWTRAQAGLGVLDAVATARSRYRCVWWGRRLRQGP